MYWLVYVTPSGWLLLSLYQAIYFGAFGMIYTRLIRSDTFRFRVYILPACIWVFLEYLRSHIGGGIGWNLLGYSQYENRSVIQMADITGVYGVSFLIVMVNICVYSGINMAVRCHMTHRRLFIKSGISFAQEIKFNPLLQTLFVSVMVLLVLFYGHRRIGEIGKSQRERMSATIIQANIPQSQKWDPAFEDYITKTYRQMTLSAAKDNADIMIWPETSVPGYLNKDIRLQSYIRSLAMDADMPLLVGAPLAAQFDDEQIGDYNSAILFSEKGQKLKQYDKIHLVAFGEFVPFERYIPGIRGFLPLTGNFIPGDELTLFDLVKPSTKEKISFSVLICFEDIFPDLVRSFVRGGAELLINMTNDAWFGKSAAAYQHAANSVFRAVENRRPFVRSANTGLSCFIDPTGSIYSRVSSGGEDLFVRGHKTDKVFFVTNGGLTFYSRFGDIFALICSLVLGVFLFDYIRSHMYNK